MTDNFKEIGSLFGREGGAPLPEDALGTPEEQGIRAMLIATGEPPREVTLLPEAISWASTQRPGRAGRSRMERLPAWKDTSPSSANPVVARRRSMPSDTVWSLADTTFPSRPTIWLPAGTRSRRMHLQGMRPERMTRTSDRTQSDKK